MPPSLDPARRSVAGRPGQLGDPLDALGERLREAAVRAVGQAVAAPVRALLGA
jgi:hypothetical protein